MAYGDPAWLISGYHNARAVWGDPRLRRDTGLDEPRMTPQVRFTNLMSIDPPEHSRLRRLVARAFTAARVEQLRERTRRIADGWSTRWSGRRRSHGSGAGPSGGRAHCR
jgi:cytochrome P450